MVFGAHTFREFLEMLGPNPEPVGEDDSIVRMRAMPTTVVSSTLEGPFDWPNVAVALARIRFMPRVTVPG